MMSNKDYSFLGEPEQNKIQKNTVQNNQYKFLGDPINTQNNEMVDTFLGKMPRHPSSMHDPEKLKKELEELTYAAIGSPGMKVIGGQSIKFLPSGILNSAGKKIASFPEVMKTMYSKVEPGKAVEAVQKGHDILHEGAASKFQNIENEVVKRKVPQATVYPEEIDEATKYLANTEANKKLIMDAKKGDYKALHQLQSDLGKEAEALKLSDTFAERNLGKEMIDQRKKINDIIKNNLEYHGHKDLVEQLLEANKLFSKKHDIYYDQKTIAKMVNPKTRKIPKNPLNVFEENSVQMNKLKKEHPEIEEQLNLSKSKKDISNKLKKYKKRGIIGGTALTGIAGTKFLYDKLTQG